MRTHEVLVFVRRGEEFLVLRRSEIQGGYWHCVSGGVERGEAPAAAAARELLEETGLEGRPVEVPEPFSYAPEPWEPHAAASAAEIHVDCFLVDAPAGWEPRLDWEHDEHRWCTHADAVALLYWPEPRRVLAGLA
jgi:8-oxo-dGTP pyrophosphatase MutT (NUDIX family)